MLPKKGSRARQTDENTGYTANVVTESGNGEKKKTQQVRVSLTIINVALVMIQHWKL